MEYESKPSFQIQRRRRAQWRDENREQIKRAKYPNLEMLATAVGLGAVIGGSLLVAEQAVNGL